MKRAIIKICLSALVMSAAMNVHISMPREGQASLSLSGVEAWAQPQKKIKYTYDRAGNRIKRECDTNGCTTTFSNKNVTTNKNVTGCNNLDVQNVTVTNNAKLTINAAGEVKVEKGFEVKAGSELKIKHE